MMLPDVSTAPDPVKRRRSGAEARDRVAVRTAVAGVVSRFQSLQREVAFLNAALAHPSQPDDLLPRVAAVGEQVNEMSGLLERAVATLGPDQRDHGRIQDIRRALGHLRSSIPRPPVGQ